MTEKLKITSFCLLMIFLLLSCKQNKQNTEKIDTTVSIEEVYERDTISGDFNGNGIIDYAYLTIYQYGENEFDWHVNSHIIFSDSTIAPIETECFIEMLANLGDLNGDGADEIGFAERAESRLQTYSVYSFNKNQWHKLLSVDYHDSFDATDLIRKHPTKQGYVLAKTIEWDEETEWFKQVEKEIKIKTDTQKQEAFIQNYRNSVHESLKNFEYPIADIETESYKIRIDYLGNDKYRYASWKIGTSISEKPDLILTNGTFHIDGHLTHLYSFTNNNNVYQIRHYFYDDDDRGVIAGRLIVYKNAKVDENGIVEGTEILNQVGKFIYYCR
jgi:hypothetical protein